jgi:citrate lyase subunit beta / citryl-CoA lyase
MGGGDARVANAARGAIQLNGRMVERLHADMARRTIADAIAAMGH